MRQKVAEVLRRAGGATQKQLRNNFPLRAVVICRCFLLLRFPFFFFFSSIGGSGGGRMECEQRA